MSETISLSQFTANIEQLNKNCIWIIILLNSMNILMKSILFYL